MSHKSPIRADLTDPLYYLRNAQTLIDWVTERHRALLNRDELRQLEHFNNMPEPAQALLIRMVMRRGEHFRTDQLNYPELPELDPLLVMLADVRLVSLDPPLDAEELFPLLRKDELWRLCSRLAPDQAPARQLRKAELGLWLKQRTQAAQPIPSWLPDATFRLVELRVGPLMERLRLMFFGNLHQDWSEFVVTELGHQRYEAVPLDSLSGAFHTRPEVNHYLHLAQLQQQLDTTQDLPALIQALPDACPTPWLEHRRRKLAFAIAQQAERSGLFETARQLYRHNPHREAQLRYLRLLERFDTPDTAFQEAQRQLSHTSQPEARMRIQRILQRSSKKAGHRVPTVSRPALPEITLTLPPTEGIRVEQQVIRHLTQQGGQAWHVENRLFTGLFGLLLWPALFAPVPGAFFHPFQAGPADLYRPDFFAQRQMLVDAQMEQLRDGRYKHGILHRLQQKRGTACSLIHWPSLDTELVERALDLIPAQHLDAVFRHLMLDLRHHRRGLPDLLYLEPDSGSYQLVEVKGPGDRMQDHQRLWLERFIDLGIPATLCHVRHPS